MTLRLGEQTLLVDQMGEDFLILKSPVRSKANRGIVTLTVDGISEEIPVRLPWGVDSESRRIEIAEIESAILVAA